VPVNPDTAISDGYGLAGRLSLIVIAAGFVNGTIQIKAVVNEKAGEFWPVPHVFMPRTRQKYWVSELSVAPE
jgi:hypothetical protein